MPTVAAAANVLARGAEPERRNQRIVSNLIERTALAGRGREEGGTGDADTMDQGLTSEQAQVFWNEMLSGFGSNDGQNLERNSDETTRDD